MLSADTLVNLNVKSAAVGTVGPATIQAMEWAAEYPELVERVVRVIGPGLDINPYVIGLLDLWMMPIKMDPNWKGGDYFGGAEPTGVAQSLKTITLTALAHGWFPPELSRRWAERLKAQGFLEK